MEELRRLGHDVLTSHQAKRSNQRIPDEEVLGFATGEKRAVLTLNRRDFIRLHLSTKGRHGGIIVCSADLRVEAFCRADRRGDPTDGGTCGSIAARKSPGELTRATSPLAAAGCARIFCRFPDE